MEHARRIISFSQEQDVGNLTHSLWADARSVCDIWMKQPERRGEFGEREIADIREAVFGLETLLKGVER